jgi:hypothetical protein
VDVDLPRYENAEVVISVSDADPGNWAGCARCVLIDGTFWLAYRIRRPQSPASGVNEIQPSIRGGALEGPGTELRLRDDLVATCSSPLSRNRRFGQELGRGRTLAETGDTTINPRASTWGGAGRRPLHLLRDRGFARWDEPELMRGRRWRASWRRSACTANPAADVTLDQAELDVLTALPAGKDS